MDEKWKAKFKLSNKQMIQIVNTIPNDWQSITGFLHVPYYLITQDKISPGVILTIKGPDFGNYKTDYNLGYCHNLSRKDSDNFDKRSCGFYGNLGVIKGIENMIIQNKGFCGIYLEDTGKNSYPDDIKDKKKLLNNFLEKGYLIGTLKAVRGTYSFITGRERTDYPFHETEEFFLNNHDSDLPFAFLSSDDHFGKYENLAPFLNVIKDLGFKKI